MMDVHEDSWLFAFEHSSSVFQPSHASPKAFPAFVPSFYCDERLYDLNFSPETELWTAIKKVSASHFQERKKKIQF